MPVITNIEDLRRIYERRPPAHVLRLCRNRAADGTDLPQEPLGFSPLRPAETARCIGYGQPFDQDANDR